MRWSPPEYNMLELTPELPKVFLVQLDWISLLPVNSTPLIEFKGATATLTASSIADFISCIKWPNNSGAIANASFTVAFVSLFSNGTSPVNNLTAWLA